MAYYLVRLVDTIFMIYTWIILARVFLSWVNPDPYNPIVRFIWTVTEPVLAPFRAIFRLGTVGFDFSPIIAFFVLDFARRGLVTLLRQLAF